MKKARIFKRFGKWYFYIPIRDILWECKTFEDAVLAATAPWYTYNA